MPEQRSSSAVRNLRSLFENKATSDLDDSDARGRSPSSARLSVSDANGRPLSKVRASFINVQHPTMSSESPPPMPASVASKRASAFESRTESFSTNNFTPDAVHALKQEVQAEQTRRASNPDLFAKELSDEAAMESTTNTPAVEAREDQAMGVVDHAASKLSEIELPPPNEEEEEKQTQTAPEGDDKPAVKDENEPPANPDKPITGVEEQQGSMKPAMPDSEDTVSGGQGLPPVAEDLRPHNKAPGSTPIKKEQAPQSTATPKSAINDLKPTPQKKSPMSPRNSHKPEPVSTGSPQKASENGLKSPTSERKSSSSTKSPLSPLGAPKSMNRKASRSSLTAPTASSSARERRESSSVKPAAAASKRETTKAANVPSHLTAPTAASRARQESESSKPASSTGRPSITARAPPKQQVSTNKPAARTSAAGSGAQQSAPRKNTNPTAPSESFLERMMRPTAASAQKTHDKPAETKTALPTRAKSSAKAHSAPRTNGTTKPAPKSGSASKPVHPAKPSEEKHATKEPETVAAPQQKTGEPAETNGKAEPTEIPDIPIPATENGSATPKQNMDEAQPVSAALESTPAFGEDEIR